MTKTGRIQNLKQELALFAKKRHWEPFHTPKNLAMALSVECSELLELFQWMTPEQSVRPDADTRNRINEEIGDIMIYLTMIAATVDIDPIQAAQEKLLRNEKKYPLPTKKQ